VLIRGSFFLIVMRKEYDLSKGERGKFYGKVDTRNPIIDDDEAPDEPRDGESAVSEDDILSEDDDPINN
jgi:hypothetical protein